MPGASRSRRHDDAAGRTHAATDRLPPGARARGCVRGDGRLALLGLGLGRRARANAARLHADRGLDDRRRRCRPITACAASGKTSTRCSAICSTTRASGRGRRLSSPLSPHRLAHRRDGRRRRSRDRSIDARRGAAAWRAGRRSGAWIRTWTRDRARSRAAVRRVDFARRSASGRLARAVGVARRGFS